jgi:urease accessory protein
MATHTITEGITGGNLYRLMTWMSPSYPVGAYSFSHGLESAVDCGLMRDASTARNWIGDLMAFGGGQADLVFVAEAWGAAADRNRLSEVHELALAFQPTSEIRLETTAQGAAFVRATAAAWPCPALGLLKQVAGGEYVYPVVVGAVAGSHAVAKDEVMQAYGHAFAANLVSAAVRLVPLGQTEGQKITASLLDDVYSAVATALSTPLAMVSSSCVMADITSMKHEVQYTRLFRS